MLLSHAFFGQRDMQSCLVKLSLVVVVVVVNMPAISYLLVRFIVSWKERLDERVSLLLGRACKAVSATLGQCMSCWPSRLDRIHANACKSNVNLRWPDVGNPINFVLMLH